MQVGEFQVLEQLASNDAATVYRAHAPRLGRDVALVLGHADAAPQRLAAAATSLQALDHPRIPSFVADGVHAGRPYFVRQLIEGTPLSARLREHGPLRAAQAAQLMREVALLVAHVHERGAVHGALEPAHVLLVGGQPALIGFRGGGAPEDDVRDLGTLIQTVLAGSKTVDAELEALGRRCQAPGDRPTPQELADELEAFLDYGSSEERRRADIPSADRALLKALAAVLGLLLLLAGVLVVVLLRRRATSAPAPAASASAPPSPNPDASPAAAPGPGLLQQAERHRAAGRLDEALKVLDRALEGGATVEVLVARGRAQLELGALSAAQAELRRALALEPESLAARRALGRALLRAKRWEDARLQFEAVRRRAPKDAVAWRGWGRACLELGAWDQALFALRRSLELAPRDPAGHTALARFYTAAKRHDLALASLKEALALEETPERHRLRMLAAIRRCDLTTATAELDRFRAATPDPAGLDDALEEAAPGLLEAARAWKPPQRRSAIALLRRLVARFPSSWRSAELLATLQLLAGVTDKACAAYAWAVERDRQGRAAGPLAVAQLLLRRRRPAIEGLNAAIEARPKLVGLRVIRAAAHCLAGEVDRGRKVGVEALRRPSRNVMHRLGISALHSLAGRRIEAEAALSGIGLERLTGKIPNPKQAPRVARLLELMAAAALPSAYPTARLRHSLDRYGDDPWTLRWAADAAAFHGQPPALHLEALTKLHALLPEDDVVAFRLASILLDRGKLDRARKVATAASRRFPRHLGFLVLLARLADARGEIAETIKHYRAAHAIRRHPMVANNLSLKLARDPRTLAEALELATYADEAERNVVGAAAETLAWLQVLSGRLEPARRSFQRFLEHNRTSAVGWAHFADLRFRLGEREAGERALALAELLRDPDAPPVKRREEDEALAGARARKSGR